MRDYIFFIAAIGIVLAHGFVLYKIDRASAQMS